jgi:CRP-like cAMP-binding protein
MSKKAGFAFRVNQEITSLFSQFGRLKNYQQGQLIVKQGDYSNHVFILMAGEAEVVRNDRYGNENHIANLQAGDIVGEMGAFLNNKRSATVKASTDVKAIECPNQMFIRGLFSTHELTYRVLKNFAERINDLNGQVANHFQTRLMLVVGHYIKGLLVPDKGVQDVEIELSEIYEISRLENDKIVDALYNFKALKAVTKLVFPAEINIVEVEVEGQNVGDEEPPDDVVDEEPKEVEIDQSESGKVIVQVDVGRFNDTMRRISYV